MDKPENILHKAIILGHLPKKYAKQIAKFIEQEENNENLAALIDQITRILDYDSGAILFNTLMTKPNQSQKVTKALFASKEVHKWCQTYGAKRLDAMNKNNDS